MAAARRRRDVEFGMKRSTSCLFFPADHRSGAIVNANLSHLQSHSDRVRLHGMFGESTFQRGPRGRGLIGFLILGVHANHNDQKTKNKHTQRSEAELPPVTVEFLED